MALAQAKASDGQKEASSRARDGNPLSPGQGSCAREPANYHGGVPFAVGILLGIIGRLQIIEDRFHITGPPRILASGPDLIPHL